MSICKYSQQDYDHLRHSCAHLLAAAVLKLFPDAKPAIGPSIENGFYYDFEFATPISKKDLKKIERQMKKISNTWEKFERYQVSKKDALEEFQKNPYKQELIENFSQEGQEITIYQSGEFRDLCRGGHIDKPNQTLKHFKLLSLAGAYWRGDEKNQMLTRIYGTAWFSQQELENHLENLKQAELRNHRRIGQQLELFSIFPQIGSGLPVWLPKGYAMRRVLEDYMIKLERRYGYEHILTPHISRDKLFQTSGHLDFYKDSMYSAIKIEKESYYLKPMNCPAGMQVFKMKPRSYRDLPIKLGELGTVYRFEKSGELQGLQRVRGFTQNDAHIFCSKKQLVGQIEEVIEMMHRFYQDIGFEKYEFVLATSDPKKDKYQFCGSRQDWEWAESTLKSVLDESEVPYQLEVGEAAFYGPKIDVKAENVFGKKDAISTVQIDFNLPERFKLEYTTKDNDSATPFVIHRALLGSFERFFAFLIEYYAGSFPVWFAPIQIDIIPITSDQNSYAQKLHRQLKQIDLRVELHTEGSMQNRIRLSEKQKIPYMLIVGDKEAKTNQVSVRARGQKDLGTMNINSFIEKITHEIEEKIIS